VRALKATHFLHTRLTRAEFNKLSNGLSHMQIKAAVSEIQSLEQSAGARGCTEIVVKSVNMHRFRIFYLELYQKRS